jgi:FeS assembly protein IscX
MAHTFHWLDVELIGELLNDEHPTKDPMRIGFVELKKLVLALDGFKEEAGHPCNEKILETIQANWISERADTRRDEDE